MASKFLELLPQVAPMLVPLFNGEVAFYATDTRVFIVKSEGSFNVPFAIVGKEFSQGGAAHKVIQSGKPLTMELAESVYGIALKVTTIPIFDDNDRTKVLGCYGIAMHRDNASNLKRISQSLVEGLTEVSAAIEETAASASDISVAERSLNEKINNIEANARQIDKVLDFVRNIADETKMLGLNAAIEAARAGEFGRGFGVVAGEIRKLSEMSKNTTEDIRKLTHTIQDYIRVAADNSAITLHSSEEQAAATEQITASIEEMMSLVEELDRLSRLV
ncbi:MAG: methyl-accepting chemotaxis protein [Methylocystaceae bacterium]